ncbi:MAG: hypothetical protein ABJN84_02220 [Flavobacteriaceae bacterium]
MKIRIKGNSVRFRLTKTEVDTFCETGSFSEQTTFNRSTFTYRLFAKEEISALEAEFEDNTITMVLPKKEANIWSSSSRVGYDNTMRLKNGEELYLLLEKDFVCMDETIEDQSDNYPNPKL